MVETLTAGKDQVAAVDPESAEDAAIALWSLYELHYRGFAGVDPEREWDLDLLRVRRGLERAREDG